MVLYVSYPVSNEHVGTHSANTYCRAVDSFVWNVGSTFTYGGDDDDETL